MEYERALEKLVKACVEKNVTLRAAFIAHIDTVSPDLGRRLDALIKNMSPKEMGAMTELITPDKKTVAIIRLKPQPPLHDELLKIDQLLSGEEFKDVYVVPDNFDVKKPETHHFSEDPKVKKLFAQYSEAGLMGCLSFYGYLDTVQKVYCIAYLPAKIKDGQVTFSNVNNDDFIMKLKKSTNSYKEILKKSLDK